MFKPYFRTKYNGVPILSKNELDDIGEGFVSDFQPEILTNPRAVDIDRFVEFYLGMTPDYQYLSHNGVYLGMTVFNDTDKVIIYDPVRKRAEYISAKARTVIIDNRMLEPKQHHRCRFTMGHEASHDILHTQYFSYDPNQIIMFDDRNPMVQCRMENSLKSEKTSKSWTDLDWMEWQANSLSSAILMPKCAVELIVKRYEHLDFSKGYNQLLLTSHVASVFDVSPDAAEIRLKGLGYFKQKRNDNPTESLFSDFISMEGII